jgi:RNA polymerase sigma factor (sigma-70 family)
VKGAFLLRMNMDFNLLLKRISPILKRIIFRLNSRFTFFNEEDLYQEAVIHLWQDCNNGKLSDKTDSYVLQGCYFHLKNYIRKNRVKVRCVSIEEQVDEEGLNYREYLSFQDTAGREYLDNLHNKLLAETIRNNGLTSREKEILSFYAQGLASREIGKRLGVSHVRVVKLMSRIREKCKKYLD